MTTYPYTYLASFMNPAFQQTVVNQALRQAIQATRKPRMKAPNTYANCVLSIGDLLPQ